ncbi:hypothetical protein NQ318_019942 [Aromia moschata]|uniref:Uncharacterized protein n=1 Tax=Aromia moschata TaxID=1265417 RepID=A0AAV8Y7B4_9CUCU|nr:hypothetical protein NQ318_019942 [Aromia moschata]
MIFEGFVFHAKSNFEAVSTISEEIFTLMNAVFKQILLVFIKNVSYIDVVAKEYSMKLVILSHAILLHETVGFDLKTKSGIVFTHSFNIIPEMHRKNFKYKDCPALEMLKEFNDEEYITLMNTKMSVFNCSESTVIIYSSILSIVPQEKLIEVKINDEALVCLLYGGLMECAKRNTSVPHIIVEISRTLSIIVKHLKAVPQSLIKSLFLEGISYVWSHLEHFVDTVRNYTKLFFEDLVIVAAQHKNNGNRELAEILLQNVQQLSPTQCIRLIAMDNIAQHMSASYLLENFDDLQNSLLCLISEVTISEQAS